MGGGGFFVCVFVFVVNFPNVYSDVYFILFYLCFCIFVFIVFIYLFIIFLVVVCGFSFFGVVFCCCFVGVLLLFFVLFLFCFFVDERTYMFSRATNLMESYFFLFVSTKTI